MKKRGSLKIIFSLLVGIIIMAAITILFRSVGEISQRRESAELINLRTSIATRILQQSVRQEGSSSNASFSVPNSAEKICFFDTNKKYDNLRNPEISGLYSDDKVNNFFILTSDGFFQYHLDKLLMDESNNPLCIKIVNNKISVRMISKGQQASIEAAGDTEDIKCISVFENGLPENKIDIVFIGYGFGDSGEYASEVNRYINNILLEFEPFKQYRSKFNFYRIDNASISCKISDFIQCDQYDIQRAASDCPNDYVVVLLDRNSVRDFIKPVRSSAIGNIAKINTADMPFVLVHELGHSFGDLADEYVDEGYYSDNNFDAGDYANCDFGGCPTWQNVENASCYEGCSLKKYFRPTKDSIMRSLTSPDFGPVNEKEMLKRLLYYE